jgi:hypothetical protein
MIFNPEQIETILRIIEFNHTLFIGTEIGTDILTDSDIELLKLYGIELKDLQTDFTPFEQSFYFGKLALALNDKNTSNIEYNDFLKYLRSAQYEPLTLREQSTLKIAKQRTYSHIKYLGAKIENDVAGIIVVEDQKKREKYEKLIKHSVERAVLERNTVNSIVSEIGNKTGDWGRDLGRIAATEFHTVYEEGRAAEIEKRYGVDTLVYKEVFQGACRFCLQFFTTDGYESKPVIFKLSELRANGTNIGRKQSDWLPVLDSVHPWDRCSLHYVTPGYIWNNEKQMFIAPPIDKNKPKWGVKITVGDKVYNI